MVDTYKPSAGEGETAGSLELSGKPSLPICCVSDQRENLPQKVNDISRAAANFGCFFELHIHPVAYTCIHMHLHLHAP